MSSLAGYFGFFDFVGYTVGLPPVAPVPVPGIVVCEKDTGSYTIILCDVSSADYFSDAVNLDSFSDTSRAVALVDGPIALVLAGDITGVTLADPLYSIALLYGTLSSSLTDKAQSVIFSDGAKNSSLNDASTSVAFSDPLSKPCYGYNMSCGCSNDPYNRLYKTIYESGPYSFTFSTTITSICTFFVQDSSGTHTTSLVVGTPTVTGNVIQAFISGGLDYTDYRLVFIVADATGQVRERLSYMCVRDPLNFQGEGANWQDIPPLP